MIANMDEIIAKELEMIRLQPNYSEKKITNLISQYVGFELYSKLVDYCAELMREQDEAMDAELIYKYNLDRFGY